MLSKPYGYTMVKRYPFDSEPLFFRCLTNAILKVSELHRNGDTEAFWSEEVFEDANVPGA